MNTYIGYDIKGKLTSGETIKLSRIVINQKSVKFENIVTVGPIQEIVKITDYISVIKTSNSKYLILFNAKLNNIYLGYDIIGKLAEEEIIRLTAITIKKLTTINTVTVGPIQEIVKITDDISLIKTPNANYLTYCKED